MSATSAGDVLPRFFVPNTFHGGEGRAGNGSISPPSLSTLSSLPRPTLPKDKQTPIMLLLPPLRSLARHLSPDRILVDCGGRGQCGPNAVSYLLPFVGKDAMDGLQLRARVVAHAAVQAVQDSLTLVKKSPQSYFTIGQFIVSCMDSWPSHQRTSDQSSVDAWCTAMARPQTWADAAFLQVVADLYSVAIHVTSVDDHGLVSELGYLLPTVPSRATAVVEIGCWTNQHFVAIGSLLPNAAAMAPDARSREAPTALTSIAQLRNLLQQPNGPSVLVGFEFSGALTTALAAEGFTVLSCDLRPCEHPVEGFHYQGDIRDVVPLQHWERVYFFPPCFQQLRADVDCLPLKIADGRAFWGCALVLWCLACPNADVIVVEQPDTIVYDDVQLPPSVELMEFRTTQFGDSSDKFVRLAMRNAVLSPFARSAAKAIPQPHRSQFEFTSPDERDRSRSSWAPHALTCTALARLRQKHDTAAPLPYAELILLFAIAWFQSGKPLPSDYAAPDAQPTCPELRGYQRRRGPGDKRTFKAVHPPPHLRPHREGAKAKRLDGDNLTGGNLARQPDGLDLEEHMPASHQHSTDELTTSTPDHGNLFSLLAPAPPGQCLAVLMCICMLMHPLVLIHADGFTVTGVYVPSSIKSAAMRAVQELSRRLFNACYSTFMVGQYTEGAKVFTVPVDFHPRPSRIARSTAERIAMLAKGATLVWCTLAALRGTVAHDAAARAVLAASAYAGPISPALERSLDTSAEFASGRMREQSLLTRSLEEPGAPACAAFEKMLSADAILGELVLRTAEAGEDWLAEWAERISPFDVTLIPPDTINHLPDFTDAGLDDVRLSAVPLPLSTSWVPLPPRQSPLPPDAPSCVRSVSQLLLPDSLKRLDEWLSEAREDLLTINRSLNQGENPADLVRRHRAPLAIGQDELHSWARGRVWDCTQGNQGCCSLLDFQRLPTSHLNLSYLKEHLEYFPDQALVSHLLEGVKLEADVELHTVLVPHLTSLPLGFHSVDKELRRMHTMGWYAFYKELPYWPIYLNGQGAASRKLEIHRYRRTLEGGGPRLPTFDRMGIQAISLNEASRVYHMPAHFWSDTRSEFRSWLTQRGLPPMSREPKPVEGEEHPKRLSKWPKERKPQLVDVMRDISVLRRASEVLQQPAYSFGDDAKDYFNQLAMAPCEYHKLGITFLSKGGEAPGVEPDELFYISEKQLPFGLHPASNVAQRFSDALLDLFRAELDAEEWEMNQRAGPSKTKWLAQRLALQRRLGEPCVPVMLRFEAPSSRRPDIPAPHKLQDIPQGYVCPQLRLYSAYMFTDDPQFVVVTPELTIAALRAWRSVTSQVGLVMAIPEKRSLGSWSRWIGVFLVVSLGLIIVPRDKILKASVAITNTLNGQADFRLYRALCGLLEHLRAVNLRKGDVMYGLYQPHSRDGASKFGPSARITCSPLMRQQLCRWQVLLSRSCSVSVKRSLFRSELEPEPHLIIEASSDACLGDEDPAGMGGFCHGLFWNLPVDSNDLHLVTIPLLELLGALANVIILYPYVQGVTRAGENFTLRLRTDALATAYGLVRSSLSNETMALAYLLASETEAWQQLTPFLRVEHVFGDANPLADAASRQQWSKLSTLCSQLGVKPQRLEVPNEVTELYRRVLKHNRRQQQPTDDGSFGLGQITGGGELPSDPTYYPGDAHLAAKLARKDDHISPPHQACGCRAQSLPDPLLAKLRGGNCLTQVQSTQSPTHHSHGGEECSRLANTPVGGSPASWPDLLLAKLRGADDTTHTRAQQYLPCSAVRSHAGKEPPEFALTSTRASILAFPKASVPATAHSLLQARSRIERALQDPSPMGFTADPIIVVDLAEQMASTVEAGVNANTAKVEIRAWEMWVHVCGIHGTSPHRTPQDVSAHPDRTAHLLSCLLLHAYVTGTPKNKSRQFIKPDSALAYPLAIIRIFARWGITLPNFKFVNAHLAGLKADYVRLHGPHSLAPRRAEPMKFAMVRHIYSLPRDSVVAGMRWSDSTHLVFIFRRLCIFMMHTAFRIGEVCEHLSKELRFITFSCLTWRIAGVVYVQPTAPLLRSLKSGRDVAFTAPSVSKPDQYGEIHCPFPVVFTFEDTNCNPAKAMRDLELKVGCNLSAEQRRTTPLFPNEDNNPYSYSTLHAMLRKVLTHCYGSATAKLYTWHSFRSGLATALHAAGVEDSMIQLICRWMCPESLHVYRRMGIREHEKHINRASVTNVDAIQSINIPIIDADSGYAKLLDASYLEPQDEALVQLIAVTPSKLSDPHRQTRRGRPRREPAASVPQRKTTTAQCPRQSSTRKRKQQASAQQAPAVQPMRATGVGSLTHTFPPTLDEFDTFFERPSLRRVPTDRYGAGHARQG